MIWCQSRVEIPEGRLHQATEMIKECMTTYLESTFSLAVPLNVEIEMGKSSAKTKPIWLKKCPIIFEKMTGSQSF